MDQEEFEELISIKKNNIEEIITNSVLKNLAEETKFPIKPFKDYFENIKLLKSYINIMAKFLQTYSDLFYLKFDKKDFVEKYTNII